MKCGARAKVEQTKKFSWHPPWVSALIVAGVLPWAIVAMILTKRMTVQAPLCKEHESHWTWRFWVATLGLCFLGFLTVASFAILAITSDQRGGANPVGGFLCLATVLGALGFVIALAIINHTAIRPTEITERSITLTNIAPEFLDALEDERGEEEDEEPAQYRRKSRRRLHEDEDEDEDDLPRRRRQRARDDDDDDERD
jgi:hypothetical protein